MKKYKCIGIILVCLFVISLLGCNTDTAGTSDESPESSIEGAVDYPTKPIELYCPSGAGGGSDIFARTVANVIAENDLCPQPIVVVNKEGGSGTIGYSFVSEQKGDPYVLSITNSSFYAVPLAGQSPVSFKDFQHISLMCQDPLFVVANSKSDYKTFEELLNYAKENPGEITAAGTSTQGEDALSFYAIKNSAGIDIDYIPFDGSGEVITALLGGHVDIAFLGPSEALVQMESGEFIPLATTTGTRVDDYPDLPTLIESGIDVELAQNRGLVAPLGIGEEEISYLEDLFYKATQTQEWKDYLKENSMIDKYRNAEQYAEESPNISGIYEEYMKFIE